MTRQKEQEDMAQKGESNDSPEIPDRGGETVPSDLRLQISNRPAQCHCSKPTNHDGTAFGVNSQILARNDAAATTLAKCLLVDFLKLVLGWNVLQNYNPTRVRPNHHII